MKGVITHYVHFALTGLLICLCGTFAIAQTTAFNYQGRLSDGGSPANSNYDMQFTLFDTLSGSTLPIATTSNPSVAVSNGIFTVTLDFGANVFTGGARYLEIGVRPAGDQNPYTVLSPRQAISVTVDVEGINNDICKPTLKRVMLKTAGSVYVDVSNDSPWPCDFVIQFIGIHD